MKITTEDLEYVSGSKFNAGYLFKLKNNILYQRTDILIRIIKNKKVLHIGCCDHKNLIEERIRTRQWLHGLMEENCKNVIGIDINQEAVEFVNSKGFSKEEVYCKNIIDDSFLNWDVDFTDFDWVVLGEILEHVDNPVEFLNKMKNNLEKKGFHGDYIITVPNALSFVRSWRLKMKRIELVNSDHRYWFTPFTICKVMMRAGIAPNRIEFGSDKIGGNGSTIPSELYYRLREKLLKKPSSKNSYLGDTIIAIGGITKR